MRADKLIAIGSSTGGPGHLQKILSVIPSNFNASIVIGQHINSIFLESIVDSLNSFCRIPVYVGKDNFIIKKPSVVFANGIKINEVRSGSDSYILRILDDESEHYSPSIDHLFSSIATLGASSSVLAALLTGIGDDGAQGLLRLKKSGAYTIAESEKTAVVYGMPRAAYEIGAACEALDLEEIIKKILEFGR